MTTGESRPGSPENPGLPAQPRVERDLNDPEAIGWTGELGSGVQFTADQIRKAEQRLEEEEEGRARREAEARDAFARATGESLDDPHPGVEKVGVPEWLNVESTAALVPYPDPRYQEQVMGTPIPNWEEFRRSDKVPPWARGRVGEAMRDRVAGPSFDRYLSNLAGGVYQNILQLGEPGDLPRYDMNTEAQMAAFVTHYLPDPRQARTLMELMEEVPEQVSRTKAEARRLVPELEARLFDLDTPLSKEEHQDLERQLAEAKDVSAVNWLGRVAARELVLKTLYGGRYEALERFGRASEGPERVERVRSWMAIDRGEPVPDVPLADYEQLVLQAEPRLLEGEVAPRSAVEPAPAAAEVRPAPEARRETEAERAERLRAEFPHDRDAFGKIEAERGLNAISHKKRLDQLLELADTLRSRGVVAEGNGPNGRLVEAPNGGIYSWLIAELNNALYRPENPDDPMLGGALNYAALEAPKPAGEHEKADLGALTNELEHIMAAPPSPDRARLIRGILRQAQGWVATSNPIKGRDGTYTYTLAMANPEDRDNPQAVLLLRNLQYALAMAEAGEPLHAKRPDDLDRLETFSEVLSDRLTQIINLADPDNPQQPDLQAQYRELKKLEAYLSELADSRLEGEEMRRFLDLFEQTYAMVDNAIQERANAQINGYLQSLRDIPEMDTPVEQRRQVQAILIQAANSSCLSAAPDEHGQAQFSPTNNPLSQQLLDQAQAIRERADQKEAAAAKAKEEKDKEDARRGEEKAKGEEGEEKGKKKKAEKEGKEKEEKPKTTEEQILETLKMLNAAIQKLAGGESSPAESGEIPPGPKGQEQFGGQEPTSQQGGETAGNEADSDDATITALDRVIARVHAEHEDFSVNPDRPFTTAQFDKLLFYARNEDELNAIMAEFHRHGLFVEDAEQMRLVPHDQNAVEKQLLDRYEQRLRNLREHRRQQRREAHPRGKRGRGGRQGAGRDQSTGTNQQSGAGTSPDPASPGPGVRYWKKSDIQFWKAGVDYIDGSVVEDTDVQREPRQEVRPAAELESGPGETAGNPTEENPGNGQTKATE